MESTYFRHIPATQQTSTHPIVILHGWGQSSLSWMPLAHLLQQTHDVYLIDLPGFGKNPEPQEPWGPEEYAAYITEWLKTKNIPSAHFIGHSFGGKIALTLSLNYGAAESLILINASALKAVPTLKKRLYARLIRSLGQLTKRWDSIRKTNHFENLFIPRFGSKDYLAATALMRKTLVKTLHTNIENRLKHIRVPTLILWGEADTETPVEIGIKLNRLIPNSQLISFPQKGHYMAEEVGSHIMMRAIQPFYQSLEEVKPSC
jgi:Predicted hydrolases or acyltransferases (alpha/beta hydrolase superfamily)